MTVTLMEGARLRSGRYELRRELGRGGAAIVWLGTDTLLERPVAIKVLSEALAQDRAWVARFRREARLAANLSHPNLVPIYDFDADGERPYLVMAYLPGGSLYDRLDPERGEDRPDPEALARDLLAALACIHAAGIAHRDVKPGNVLLDAGGRACLTDFGIARPEDATSITQTGQIPGTGRYMAPELWRGDPANERSDLYACGVLLSQFVDDSATGALRELVGRLSAEEPELRPESATAALAMLGGAGAGRVAVTPAATGFDPDPEAVTPATASVDPGPRTPATATVADPGPRTRTTSPAPAPAKRRPGRWLALAGLCLVALIAGIAFSQALSGDDDPAPADQQRAQEREDGGGEAAADPPADQPADPEPPLSTEPPVDALGLNQEGFDLIEAGQPEDAIPLLEDAVAAYPEGTADINYAFALYNLGNAYLLAGRPEDAIPVLEERLGFDNQTDVVQATLDEALAQAGGDSDDDD